MKIGREPRAGGPLVTGFAGTGFKIDGVATSGAVFLTPEWWQVWNGDLSEAALEPLLAIGPEFLLVGTGATLVRPPRSLVVALEARSVGIEAMDSRAAARAWSVLRGEGRLIAAALMALG